jgi:chorismate mutase / prephenate dehydratase
MNSPTAHSSDPTQVACLGPVGSFSFLITEKRFPGASIETLPSIGEVFDFLTQHPESVGIVPIENSSGGFIIDTVDRLVDKTCALWIQEELTLDVKLALLGHSGAEVEVIYSHPMPFFHAKDWLDEHYPTARRVTKASTAASAELAAADPKAATIGPRQNAQRYGLDLLHFPISGEVPNITQFFLLGHSAPTPQADHNRTALVVELADKPGSLCLFLTPLSEAGINMKRLESRPIRGQPNQYRFYIEIEGSPATAQVAAALARATADGATLRSLGSYSSRTLFES